MQSFGCEAAAAPAVRRERAEARRRALRFHASTMMEPSTSSHASPLMSPAGGPRIQRRVSTPWAGLGSVALSWADGDEPYPWVPASPPLPLHAGAAAQSELQGAGGPMALDDSPPDSPALGSRKDSLDCFLSEREVLGTRTFAGHEAWSMRRPDDIA
eukprot:TRINITY_DN21035_c0_g1_i1.p1 TRINITY_DN21035_c0_g1~~TRINITY_DN21035_c0_g1_i1.p1  ORF type:complete len:157 (+),score=27.08 TRINITY_DN21035_c0_g1_i1:133-603(+)